MQRHEFGRLWPVSALTLGGGGLGMLWGPTSFDECVATVHDAVAAGVDLLDLAPRYGDGKAEEVVGEAFAGRLPDGVRVTSKCNLGEPLAYQIDGTLRRSIDDSLERLHLSRLDLFFLHSNVVPDAAHIARRPAAAARMTLYSTFVDHVRPVFERLVAEGVNGAWGLTGIGHPDTIIKLLGERPAPAAVQCIANLLDSPGGLKFFDGPAKPRAVMTAARANGAGIMGIRAVQAGALTASIDRPLPADHPEVLDYNRAAGFRRLAAELGEDPAVLAHRYALSLDIDTLVLGVKNRAELAGCVAAAAAGPLSAEVIAQVDRALVPAKVPSRVEVCGSSSARMSAASAKPDAPSATATDRALVDELHTSCFKGSHYLHQRLNNAAHDSVARFHPLNGRERNPRRFRQRLLLHTYQGAGGTHLRRGQQDRLPNRR